MLAAHARDFTALVERKIRNQQLQIVLVSAIRSIADSLAIGREERPAIVALGFHNLIERAGLKILHIQIAALPLERAIEQMPAVWAQHALGVIGLVIARQHFQSVLGPVGAIKTAAHDLHVARE